MSGQDQRPKYVPLGDVSVVNGHGQDHQPKYAPLGDGSVVNGHGQNHLPPGRDLSLADDMATSLANDMTDDEVTALDHAANRVWQALPIHKDDLVGREIVAAAVLAWNGLIHFERGGWLRPISLKEQFEQIDDRRKAQRKGNPA